jgi:hypothetical protein
MYVTVTDDKDPEAKKQDSSDYIFITLGEKSAEEDEGCAICESSIDEGSHGNVS